MRKQQILEAAAKVFSEKGYYHTKIQEIADEANIGKGTVYEYFNSKEALFIEIIKVGTQKFQAITMEELSRPKPFWTRLYGVMNRHVDFLWENREFACLLLGRESQVVTESELYGWLLQVREDMLHQFEQAFNQAIQNGEVTSGDSALYAKMIHGLGEQVIGGSILLERKKPSQQELKGIIKVLMEGIRTKKAEAELILEE